MNVESPMRMRSPGVQRPRAVEELLVEVGPVRRAEILDHDDPALAHEPRVAGGGERILEMDLDVAAPERRALLDVVLHAPVMAGHRLDDEPRGAGARIAARLAAWWMPVASTGARGAGPAPTGRRRSFSALRATQRRKR